MTIVTIGLSSPDDARPRLAGAFRGEPQGDRISFASVDLLWQVLGAKRLEILRAMTGQSALPIREVARRVGRDVKAVHGDIVALISAGLVERAEGGVLFPYDGLHVDFTLTQAA